MNKDSKNQCCERHKKLLDKNGEICCRWCCNEGHENILCTDSSRCHCSCHSTPQEEVKGDCCDQCEKEVAVSKGEYVYICSNFSCPCHAKDKGEKFDLVNWLRNTYGLEDGDTLNAGEVQELCQLLLSQTREEYRKEVVKIAENLKGEAFLDLIDPDFTKFSHQAHGYKQALSDLIAHLSKGK